MVTEDQTDVVEFLAAPSTHGAATVEGGVVLMEIA